ncbi:hypothetical protein [Kribbella sp. VKM Ac-2568]|uniref:hypothetical protein n=1 Tax=Kribbella sp. VKM Ac-2568 TaxID=2512219 RepID=UPI00104A6222|nr:hypothetical protein [Kribbella sp. VKM Ac-2568]TCM51599.1 hypothetical protein EV648_101436 [Kribbella sp. VKM Ac-2568]
MFACDVTELTAAETLASAAQLHAQRNRTDVELLDLALHFADLHPDPATVPGHHSVPGGERGVVYGGPGCPAVAEFAVAEFGAATGRSTASAAAFFGQALALRHRLPRILAQVRSEHATAWKACTIATACLHLSEQAAALVDAEVADIVDTLTPHRLANIVRAALWRADPEAAQAAAEARAKERGVWPGRTDEHGTTTLYVKAATGDIIRLNTTLTQLADALADLGDTDPLHQRRAKAIGILADPALAQQLLTIAHHLTQEAPTPNHPPNQDAPTTTTRTPTPTSATRAPTPTSASALASAPAPAAATPAAPSSPGQGAQTPAPPTAPRDQAPPVIPHPASPRQTAGPDQPATPGRPSHLDDEQRVDDPGQNHEPGPDDEADRDAPHPSEPAFDERSEPRPAPDHTATNSGSSASRHPGTPETPGAGMDAAARRELARKLAAVKQGAYSNNPTSGADSIDGHTTDGHTGGAGSTGRSGHKPTRTTTVYVHITDQTLLTGGGITRVERFGPVYAARLQELLGHDQITLKPVIDLNNKISVDAYEIPRRIREHIKLTHPVEQFPYGTAETTHNTDLDHIQPYNFNATGPPDQTSTTNLTPLRRYSHRVKTHGGWRVRRLDDGALQWTTKHGYTFRVDHTGTHPLADGV